MFIRRVIRKTCNWYNARTGWVDLPDIFLIFLSVFDHISTNDLQNTLFTLHRSKSQFAFAIVIFIFNALKIGNRHTAHQTLDACTTSVQCTVKFQFDTCEIPIKHLPSVYALVLHAHSLIQELRFIICCCNFFCWKNKTERENSLKNKTWNSLQLKTTSPYMIWCGFMALRLTDIKFNIQYTTVSFILILTIDTKSILFLSKSGLTFKILLAWIDIYNLQYRFKV